MPPKKATKKAAAAKGKSAPTRSMTPCVTELSSFKATAAKAKAPAKTAAEKSATNSAAA